MSCSDDDGGVGVWVIADGALGERYGRAAELARHEVNIDFATSDDYTRYSFVAPAESLDAMLEFADTVMRTFGFEYTAYLATRPEDKFIGDEMMVLFDFYRAVQVAATQPETPQLPKKRNSYPRRG